MKGAILLLFFVLFSTVIFAQPNYSLRTYNVQSGKKTNFYLREARQMIKQSNFNAAVLNGATALKGADKKRQYSEAQERLNDSYERAMTANLARVEVLKETTREFEDDKTVTDIAELIRIYKTMISINDLLESIPEKAYKPAKRKDTGFTYEPTDFREDLRMAEEQFEKSKEDAAAMHYAKGRELESSESKSELRQAAKRYSWANKYVADYRDAMDRYEDVKKLATTRLGISRFDASSIEYGNLGAKLSEMLLSDLSNKSRSLEFFEVIDREQLELVLKEQELSLSGFLDESTTADIGELKGIDAILVGTLTESIVDRQQAGPTERSYTKEVVIRTEKYTDEDGKEKTKEIKGDVSVTTKEFSKSAIATVGCTYKVIDIGTGTVLESGSVVGKETWNFTWIGSFRGDKRALPSRAREERKYPSISSMTNSATRKASSDILRGLNSYLNEVGK